MRLTGRVAIVTGASRGIGLAVARRLVAEGARVCVTARHAEALEAAVAELNDTKAEPDDTKAEPDATKAEPDATKAEPDATGDLDRNHRPRAMFAVGRADDPDHRAETVRRVTERFGAVDLLVNNTGINPVFGPLLDLDLGAARKILDVNLLGALGWVQEVCRTGLVDRGGTIVNMSSVGAVRPAPGIAFYGVSKAALSHLTACLAVELGPSVRVNAVAPGIVKTRFARPLYEGREEQAAEAYPLKRLGTPEDVAGAVAFLASDDSAWLTGQTLVLDGGITLAGGTG